MTEKNEKRLGTIGAVQLESGKVVSGQIVKQNGSFGWIRTANGKEICRPLDQISPDSPRS